ncbi:MAG: hypothetical protein H2174_08500 [Vampirovibrio sp.]|nr:hypothetical protein [Vampirovibrio sp.]
MWGMIAKPVGALGFLKQKAVEGSASMVFMSLAFLTLLLAVNVSLSGLQKDLTTAGLEGKEASSLESIANGALQEVLATRFYPASNRLNWQFNSPNDLASTDSSLKPFFKNSSFILTEGATPQVFARYQYVIVGGHPARDPLDISKYLEISDDDSYNKLADPESTNIQRPLYVLLRTFGCMNKQSLNLVPNAITVMDGKPTCSSVTELKQYDLLTKVRLIPADTNPIPTPTPNADKYVVEYSKRVNFTNPIELDEDVLRPTAITPAVSSQINFSDFWPASLSTSSTSTSMANLERVLLETSSVKQTLIDVTTSPTVSNIPVSADTPTQLHLYFRGSMDSRSFYKYNYAGAVNTDGIITDPAKLNIQLTPYGSSSSLLGGATFDFNYPAADHLTITLNNRFTCDKSYTLSFPAAATSADLREKLRDSYGASATGTASTSITFNTEPCSFGPGGVHKNPNFQYD